MPITALYAGLLAPLFVLLSIRVIAVRRSGRVAVGDGGNRLLLRRMRVHANFAEYVPLALVLMALAEATATPAWLIHPMGVALLAGRIVHAIGMSREAERFRFRVVGMALTFTVLLAGSAACLMAALRSV
jgi:uncharacterized membrane protein YecN with MAPEG domain